MAYLAKGKKQDLLELAETLDVTIAEDSKILEIKDAIINSPTYDPDFTKECLNRIISDRKELEQRAQRDAENQRLFELEKLKLQNMTITADSVVQSSSVVQSPSTDSDMPKLELHRLLPTFDHKSTDISLFLDLFEKQLTFLKVPPSKWVVYLVGLLPTDITNLIVKESSEDTQNYDTVKQILLKRFKLSAEKFRQLFAHQKKNPETTWRDFYFDLKNYFDGWIKESKVTTLEELKDLILADQIKKKAPPNYKDHFLDQWCDWNNPLQLADKLDAYDEVRSMQNKAVNRNFHSKEKELPSKSWKGNYQKNPKKFLPEQSLSGFPSQSRRETGVPSNSRRNPTSNDRARERNFDESKEDRRSVSCYGCGAPGIIKSKCRICNPVQQKDDALSPSLNQTSFYSFSTENSPISIIEVSICNTKAAVCADTGATHSVAGEKLYHLLLQHGLNFKEKNIAMTLADGQTQRTDILTTVVDIAVQGKIISTELIVLKNARGNRTLLGVDFLQAAGIVLDLQKKQWCFTENSQKKYNFVKAPPNINALLAVNNEPHPCQLRENEGTHLSLQQQKEVNSLLEEYQECFRPGGGPTPLIKHHINTGNHPPVSAPPYRLSPQKKEILKRQLDEFLDKDIIEECESPYAAPVVLVPKPNNKWRLCIDYRKLNAITISDKYPLPRMDDLMHDAKSTAFMSTIDLKAGYHQIEVSPDDRDKTAFVCSYGTFRFKRMPFGLRNAPATFQRLMDSFKNGLPTVNILTYLDDIIILSPTFEQHLLDLELVFQRLLKFNLSANREKCHFGCLRVKYLGLWITPQGIQTDPDKVAAIQTIPPPQTLKQLQSFIQTCSWYRKFIPNFAAISKPLTNLTKKNSQWSWTETEHSAFEKLKECLTTAPVLKQVDGTKPFVIRTDASNYALGAVLAQRQGEEEHPIEYASRLLTPAEKNYTTTEREALAVVWALNKFRGYIEGSTITVITDHQPLRWLLSLKSPTGRLARWALEIQSFDLKVDYINGKSNVVADMLSRPVCKNNELTSGINSVAIDLPSRQPSELRAEQLKDPEIKKIIDCLESSKIQEEYANWNERGYLLNQGILYKYAPDSDAEEAQLVVPSQERNRVLQEHHDAPTAGHYGAEGTYHRIVKKYYWLGMKKFIADYVKNCPECSRYKASNQKPSGLLQTPVMSQRFETIAIDLFGPLPEDKDGMKWIFIIEDYATKWVELFALKTADAKSCAITLLNEVFMRYGLPRRIISDNGSQFVSSVMQQLCFLLGIKQSLTPVYHPQANPVERKNRDLKPRLAIYVQNDHTSWAEKLPTIRFAMNTARCETTGQTSAFLQFGRELRTPDDVSQDLRSIINNDNFVPEITPYLKRFARHMSEVKERTEQLQDKRKTYADKLRRKSQFSVNDKVWVELHPISKHKVGKTAKFMPRRDGPYIIISQNSPTTYTVADLKNPSVPLGSYHSSALRPYYGQAETTPSPVIPLRKRGRPKKRPGPSSKILRGTRGGV